MSDEFYVFRICASIKNYGLLPDNYNVNGYFLKHIPKIFINSDTKSITICNKLKNIILDYILTTNEFSKTHNKICRVYECYIGNRKSFNTNIELFIIIDSQFNITDTFSHILQIDDLNKDNKDFVNIEELFNIDTKEYVQKNTERLNSTTDELIEKENVATNIEGV